MEPRATQASVKEKMKEDGIEFILAQFVDIHGSRQGEAGPRGMF